MIAGAMPKTDLPEHQRRAKRARRVQLLLAFASAAFVLYRLVAAFLPRSGLGR
jgi:hypothetical protein